ncbi:MlaD family protein [Cochleicola gelatinilyticus]|uniref:ABC transporter substrate-binding protein n=1 Tax=Cochleicola gelatinilyticus TaxID=1763537 RepID=A0A167GVA9_9FLAO|nr:MlaD family protein [Cochleicola gelatinilyticus]OAB77940.1 ABC transporter substrate-binding protein [Cochleicola gelatinilyticus]
MRLSREVKTGILAIGAILLFIFGYSYLKGTNLLEKKRTFFVKYDNVEGLAKSAPVTINGLNVGKVQSIDFANREGGLIVEFALDEDFDFSKNSLVRIYSSGLIGGKSLGVFPVYDRENIAKSGDTLRGEIEDGMLSAVTKALGPLEKKVNNTLATVDTLLLAFTDVVDEPTRRDLKSAIKNLNATLNSLNGVSTKLNGVLAGNSDKLDRTFTNLDITAKNFATLSDSLSQLETGKLVTDLQDVVSRFDAIVEGIDNGEGTVGKLLKDEQLYENLEGASRQLEELMQDLKLNPKRYVHLSIFGRKNKEYEKPEDPNK